MSRRAKLRPHGTNKRPKPMAEWVGRKTNVGDPNEKGPKVGKR